MIHTPGPWELCECGKCGMVFGDGGQVIVHYPPNTEVVGPVPSEELRLADARLIEAAPRLLEALKDMCLVHEIGDKLPADSFIESYNKAQAAIRAVEGGSQ